ncbi:hypothetical protein LH128_24657 [Sphingomonas sp. LH128]|uniref:hypothetical protein n=1 Tax=Sphingomonas sp. LH128 TaxID=473781 RepID=UPI00027CA432|nr:hypothetical protein [Sphingomonas sp. LH128]EJU10297.1 hypothetical protein LH128_24657 [Sphingomonas sp. LH128]
MNFATSRATEDTLLPYSGINCDINDATSNLRTFNRRAIAERCQSLLEADSSLRSIIPNGLLSHEARLILQLAVKGGTIVKEAALSSWLSDRAFYELSKRLERHGVIRQKTAPNDLRTKRMFLNDDLWDSLSSLAQMPEKQAAANCEAVAA